MYLSQSSTNLSFVVNSESLSATEGYKISADFKTEGICDWFRQSCSSFHLLTELSKSNENDSVSITVGKAEVVVEIPDKCRCLASDNTNNAVTAATSDNSNNDAVIAASVLSVLVAIAIAGVIVVLIFYCRKTKSITVEG